MSLKRECPCCGSSSVRPFYEARDVPVESSVVLRSRDEALAFPRGDVVLAFCADCGFIFNQAYPERSLIPAGAYEDQQGFSSTFTAFAERTARALIARYDLRDKDIVEVGCGQGDFLALLCSLGDNRGVGIDPRFDGSRLPPEDAARITAVPERYEDAHALHRADLIACRHTLEHVPDAAAMLGLLCGAPGGPALVIEVPDVVRILDEGAFWDVYYEHCSYFSPGSLARALRRAGHGVDDVVREYGEQYLISYSRPAKTSGATPLGIEESPDALQTGVGRFERAAAAGVERWRARVGERPVIWGSGSKCVAFATTLGIAERVAAVVDINPHRHGRFMPGIGRPVCAPEALRDDPPDTVVAMNPVYRNEIEASLRTMGLDSEVGALS